MENTKNFWKSKTVLTALALLVLALYRLFFLSVSPHLSPEDLNAIGSVRQDVETLVVSLYHARWLDAITALGAILVVFFRYNARERLK